VSFAARTVRGSIELPGWRVVAERLLRDGDGNITWLLGEPRRRAWSATGVLTLGEPVGWRVSDGDNGATLTCSDSDAETDLVELRGEAARAFERDASEPMTVIPSFRPLAGPPDLEDYLVGGRVVTGGPLARWQVEQAALSIYRIARLRGGAFWSRRTASSPATGASRARPRGQPTRSRASPFRSAEAVGTCTTRWRKSPGVTTWS
jgi:hypothetical protein